MGVRVEQSVVVDAPLEEVWEYVANNDEWRRPVVKEVTPLTEGEHGVGSRYEVAFEALGKERTAVNEITEYEPPHRMRWRQETRQPPAYVTDGGYTLESTGDGRTRFTLDNTYESPGLWKLMSPGVGWTMRRKIYPTLLGNLQQRFASGD